MFIIIIIVGAPGRPRPRPSGVLWEYPVLAVPRVQKGANGAGAQQKYHNDGSRHGTDPSRVLGV